MTVCLVLLLPDDDDRRSHQNYLSAKNDETSATRAGTGLDFSSLEYIRVVVNEREPSTTFSKNLFKPIKPF